MNILIISLIISSLTLIILIQTDKFSKKYGFYDNPRKELKKIHKKPISNIGGLACLIPFLIAVLSSYFYDDFLSKKYLTVLFVSSICFYFLGRLDDIKNLYPNRKFLSFSLIFLFFFPFEQNLIINELNFKYVGFYVDLNSYSIFFTLFCIFLFYNASNFIDGINGLYGTTLIYWLVFILFKSNYFSLIIVTTLISIIYFLIFNFKNKVFIGNAGNSFLTCFVASIYIYYYNRFDNIYCDEIFLAFFIPGLDTVRLSLERIFKKRSPFEGDNEHLHHLILKYLNPIKASLGTFLLTVLPMVILLLSKNFYISLIFSLALYSLLVFLLKRNYKKKRNFNKV